MRTVQHKTHSISVLPKPIVANSQYNLYFNLVHFDWLLLPQQVHFTIDENYSGRRIPPTDLPKEIYEIYTSEELANGAYTTFEYPHKDFIEIPVNLKNAPINFSKHFFRERLKYYFKKELGLMTQRDFIDSLIVWLPNTELEADEYWVYDKYSIRVFLQEQSKKPALLLSVLTKTKVLKAPVTELQDKHNIPASLFNKVMYSEQQHRLEEVQQMDKVDLTKCFPVLNKELSALLKIKLSDPVQGNKYLRYNESISQFYTDYFDNDIFKSLFPISDEEFLTVQDKFVGRVNKMSNALYYGKGIQGNSTPKVDFRRLHPATPVVGDVRLFFIYHTDYKAEKDLLKKYLQEGKFPGYPGLNTYASMTAIIEDDACIEYKSKENPFPDLEAKFNAFNYAKPNVKYFGIYITPFTKEESREQEFCVFARMREFLLNRNIASQSIEPATIKYHEVQWSLTTMSVAMVAKLGGVPWRLRDDIEPELIVGIGAFINRKDNVKYMGASVCFDNSGRFNDSGWFEKDEIKLLAGAIGLKVKEYAATYGEPKRLIIHLYKALKDDELKPIEDELRGLELRNDIPIYIVAINKTLATDIVAFDRNMPELLMPETGTYILIGNKKYLLFNNTRIGRNHRAADKYHFPLKLTIDSNKEGLLEDREMIRTLIDQVYYFSKLYYKSLLHQNLPVTVVMLDQMAEFIPRFETPKIPDFGMNIPWMI